MRIVVILLLLFALSSCRSTETPRPIVRFYREALKRSQRPDKNPPADATDLRLKTGWLPGAKRYPRWDEDSIVISDPDPHENEAVLIIVNPRVSGSFLDTEYPDDEFLKMLELNARYALEHSRYLVVQLLPKQ